MDCRAIRIGNLGRRSVEHADVIGDQLVRRLDDLVLPLITGFVGLAS
jgi:hypothetical protein